MKRHFNDIEEDGAAVNYDDGVETNELKRRKKINSFKFESKIFKRQSEQQ